MRYRFVKITALLLLAILALFALTACGDDGEDTGNKDDVYYTVSFITAGGTNVNSVKVKAGGLLEAPDIPVKEGYIFDGWKEKRGVWNFPVDKVTEDTTLTAMWVDARDVFVYRVENEEVIIEGYEGKVESIRIPKMLAGYPVVAVDDRAFTESDSDFTTEIILGENIRTIGDEAFYGCGNIKIKVEAKPKKIGEKAFYNCAGLEEITFGEGMDSVPYMAFYGCSSLKSVSLPKSVTAISENAFEQCGALQSVVIYDTLEIVEDGAFKNCTSFKAVYIYGEEEAFYDIDVAEGNSGNDSFLAASVYSYSEKEPADKDGGYWYYDENGKIRLW